VPARTKFIFLSHDRGFLDGSSRLSKRRLGRSAP
jgi:hypothetical protein